MGKRNIFLCTSSKYAHQEDKYCNSYTFGQITKMDLKATEGVGGKKPTPPSGHLQAELPWFSALG